jgi:integrase/recombinase XerC
VFIPGSGRTDARWGYLTDWGITHLRRRLLPLADVPGDPPVVYAGSRSSESAQASACSAVSSVLARAGLGREPDIGPASVAAWAGADARSRGLPIEEIARILGVHSLDRAARIIGWDWRTDGPQG